MCIVVVYSIVVSTTINVIIVVYSIVVSTTISVIVVVIFKKLFTQSEKNNTDAREEQ
jgi:hypothetical protein